MEFNSVGVANQLNTNDEKSLDCSDAIQELHESLASLYEDNFNNAKDDFENQLGLLEHMTNQFENGISMLEAKGYLESTKYYSALQDVEKQNIAVLNKELADLEKYFSEAMASGEIEEYSEAWYSMQSDINGVKEAIAEANVELVEYAKTMREIEWGYFDYTQERIDQLTQESNFLIDLMSNSKLYDDKGQFTDEGTATMGLHAQNYNVYMAKSDAYAQEILEINKQLADDPYNVDLIKRREELLGLQQDSILAAEEEKQAIIDMVEEGINLELESLQDLIDKYNEALDSQKDLYDYQKRIAEQTKNISSLEKELSAYENDTSEETRAKLQKIKIELEAAKEDLKETEYEKMVSETKEILNSLYEEYEILLNERLDNTDMLISDMIDTANTNTDLINQTLNDAADNVGYTISENMRSIWDGSTGAIDGTLSKYGDNFTSQFTAIQAVLNSIQANTAAMVGASDKQADKVIEETKPVTKPSNPPPQNKPAPPKQPPQQQQKKISVGGKINAGSAKIYDYAGDTSGERQYYRNDPVYKVLKEQNGWLQVRYHKLSSGITGWFKKGDVKAYKTGGLVDYTGLAQLDGTPGKPELVLNATDTKNFLELKDTLREMAQKPLSLGGSNYGEFGALKLSGLADISGVLAGMRTHNGNTGNSIGEINITIPIDHVENYEDFVNKLRKDPKFERLVQAMTTDRLAGGSSLAKNKFKW